MYFEEFWNCRKVLVKGSEVQAHLMLNSLLINLKPPLIFGEPDFAQSQCIQGSNSERNILQKLFC